MREAVRGIERLNRAIERLQARKSTKYREAKRDGLSVQALRDVVGRRAANAHHGLSGDPVVRLYEEQLDGLSTDGPRRA